MKKYCIISFLVLLLDQLSKHWAYNTHTRGMIDIWPGVIRFRFARNTGAAFSIFNGNVSILAAATAVMLIIVVIVFFRANDLGGIAKGGLTLVFAGGVGNLIDRIARGYVVDFIEPVFVNFAIFNLADVAICLGAFLVAMGYLREGGKHAADG